MQGDIKRIIKALSFVTFVSSTLVGCLLLGYFLGGYADDFFSIRPKGRLIGLICGIILAVYSIYKHLRFNFIDSHEEKDD